MTDDAGVRAAAFTFLNEQTLLHGEIISRNTLARGFTWHGVRVPLVGPQGHPGELSFSIAVDDARAASNLADLDSPVLVEARRAYVTRVTYQRLHQQTFRQRVLRAYQLSCAICRLRHEELLEAAHILPDGHPLGEPVVSNGLALCKLHHAAFDRHILGIRPDCTVELRSDVRDEIDGPMLRHGLQGFQHARIVVPRNPALRPDIRFLAERYDLFLRAR